MPTQVQFRRGTTAQNNSFTGAAGELSINTSNSTIRVHDGSTIGGFELAKVSDVTTAVTNLIDAAPGALNTLNELAAAINDDSNFATTIINQLGNKANTASLTTANVSEVNNLYFTNARVYSNVITIGYATNANVSLKANLTDKLNVFASTSSSELAGVISDETGSGALVFATSPTLVTPILGTPQSGTLTSCTGLPLSTGITGTLAVANGGTGTASPATVAGTGISVTGSFPNQTITNSGVTSLVAGTNIAVSGGTGAVTVSVTGTVSAATNATNSTNSNITDDTTTNSTHYPNFVSGTSGNQAEKVSSTKLTFNPSTGLLTSTDYNSSSDKRLKKNIKTIESALDKVIALRGVSFDWKEGGAKAIGLIAQEAEKVIPEIVSQDENGYLGIKYNNLIGVLIEAIKDQQEQIEALKNRIDKL